MTGPRTQQTPAQTGDEQSLRGIAASPGLGIGPAFVLRPPT
ncbi:hypothetical protein ACFP81_12860 [Deinococcus lacus]|uniref:Uncharacterized protein n=1 Tax=Deinococcus lacus TaxID=392561 RepID=A0ABW1YEN0_9DEIO